jgi:nucleotide-binding universal stress UspA family protein
MIPKEAEERTATINYFPTKILLATDASKDAVKAAQIASDIAGVSGSELDVLHVGNTKDFHVAPGADAQFPAYLLPQAGPSMRPLSVDLFQAGRPSVVHADAPLALGSPPRL